MKLLDRYILFRFLQFLVFALVASAIIFITVDSTEQLDKFIDAKLPYSSVLYYYYLYLPYIIYLTLPVSVLLATLFTIGGFVYRNELTAMQSAGYSFWRILAMFLFLAVPISGLTLLFGESVVPAANRERKEMYRTEVKKLPNPASSKQGRLYIQVGTGEFLRLESYDPQARVGEKVALHLFVEGKLARRIEAERMRFQDSLWVLEKVEVRAFPATGLHLSLQDTLQRADFTIQPEDLSRINVDPEEMNYFDLKSLVERLTTSGIRAGRWVVDLAFKLSQPFATVIIVLFGVPFAAYRRRGGLVLGFGLSLLVCFVYFGFMQVGKILGYHGAVEPVLAAWSGNIVFGALGIYLAVRVPK